MPKKTANREPYIFSLFLRYLKQRRHLLEEQLEVMGKRPRGQNGQLFYQGLLYGVHAKTTVCWRLDVRIS
jgi:hypothetical protein